MSLAVHLTIGGTYTISATWTDTISPAASASSCEEATKGFVQDGLRYLLPRSPRTTSYDGHVLSVTVVIVGYHGPAAYDPPNVVGEDGTPTVLFVDGAGWAAAGGGTVHVDLKADNSGLLVFEKLTPVAPPAATPVSGQTPPPAAAPRTGNITGTLAWTCTSVRQGPTTDVSPSGTAAPAPASPASAGPTPTPPH